MCQKSQMFMSNWQKWATWPNPKSAVPGSMANVGREWMVVNQHNLPRYSFPYCSKIIHWLPPQSTRMSFLEVKRGSKPKILQSVLEAVSASFASINFKLKRQAICSLLSQSTVRKQGWVIAVNIHTETENNILTVILLLRKSEISWGKCGSAPSIANASWLAPPCPTPFCPMELIALSIVLQELGWLCLWGYCLWPLGCVLLVTEQIFLPLESWRNKGNFV